MGLPPKIVGKVQEISTGYTPRTHQKWLHGKLKRFNVLVFHRRFGKSVFAINEMIDRALRNTKSYPVYGYFAPTFSLVEEIAWVYFQEYCKDIPGVKFNQQKLRITIDRPEYGDFITIQLKSTDKPDSVIGKYYDGAVLDEYQSMDPDVFNKLFPTLSDRQGWLIIIGTARGTNDLYRKHELAKKNPGEWFTMVLKASETKIIPESELALARAAMLPEQYEQEYESSFSSALVGSYYGSILEEMTRNKQIRRVLHDPALDVDTSWDLGMDDSMTIWFVQQLGSEKRIIDYYEFNGKGLDHYINFMNKKPYVYRYYIMPHDIEVRELGTGKSRKEVLISFGIKEHQIIVVPKMDPRDRINAARLALPTFYINDTGWTDERGKLNGCAQGLDALRNYARSYDQKTQKFSDKPDHNWASHGADSFGTLCFGLKPPGDPARMNKMYTTAKTEYNIYG